MAGFGHIAVGAVAARLHGDTVLGRSPWRAIAFPLLAMLPDLDVIPLALGAPDSGLLGHRGFTHTPLFALAVGMIFWILARRHPRRAMSALIIALVVGSHSVLDALAQDGRGLLFFWPLSAARYHFLWRPIPDAPMGGEIFTRLGLEHILTEIIYFLPLTLFAARPLLVGGFREMRSRRPPRPAPAPRPAP